MRRSLVFVTMMLLSSTCFAQDVYKNSEGKDCDLAGTAMSDKDNGIKVKWIEVSGWAMFDVMHVNAAENTNPGGAHNWRATCWEIHPITSIKKLSAAPAESHTLHPDVLHTFHLMQAASLNRN